LAEARRRQIEESTTKLEESHLRLPIRTKYVRRVDGCNSSIDVLEILAYEIRVIGAGMHAEDAEEVVGIDDLAAPLRQIILNKGKEGFIADAAAQVIKKMSAAQIYCFPVWLKSLTLINGKIHKTLRVKEVDPIGPPISDKIGINTLVIYMFGVSRQAFVQPRLLSLVITHLLKPPLMGGLVRTDEGQVIQGGTVILFII